MLLSTLFTMWPIHLQGFSLLPSTVREEMHSKKIHYLTLDLEVKVNVTQNVAQYPLHHVAY